MAKKQKTIKSDDLLNERRDYLEDFETDNNETIDFAKPKTEQAADELFEAGADYLERHNNEAVVDITAELEAFGYPEETMVEVDGEFVEGALLNEPRPNVIVRSPSKPKFIYNRLASIEGYNGFGVSYRKGWEIEMALKTLHDLGGAHPNANILGVGAGTERTIFELANAQSAALVTPTDIYLTPGVWADWHGEKFLKNPHHFAPEGLPYDPARIIPMHVDMMDMPYENEVYDAVFSSGSIEHVGYPKAANWEQVAKAAKEIGRVLKKGGIASISTEFKVAGDGWGFEGVRLFSRDDIMRYIVEPSGLEFVDEPDWDYHGDLDDYVELADAVRNPKAEENKPLLRHGGFLFTSIHLCLRKGK